MERFSIIEKGGLALSPPVDFNNATVASPWVNFQNYPKIYALVVFDNGGAAPVISLEQATSAAGAGAKALKYSKLHYQSGAALSALRAWSKEAGVDRETPKASFDTADIDGATTECAVLIEIEGDDEIDVQNGFTFVRVKAVTATSAAKLGYVMAFATEGFYVGDAAATL